MILSFLYNLFIVIACLALLAIVLVIVSKFFFHFFLKNSRYVQLRSFLTGIPVSDTSYMLAHGFFVFLVFCGILLAAVYFFPPTEKAVANKYIKIGVTSEVGKLQSFTMNLSQPWEIEGKNEKSLNRDFSISFIVDREIKDTVDFDVTVRSNFDATFWPDTSMVLSMDIDTKTNKKTEFKVTTANKDLTLLPNFSIKSDASIFDDRDCPYVNFYLSFDKPFSCLPQDSAGNLIGHDTQLYVYLNTKVDSLDFGDMKYDVVSLKPEPDTNNPYEFSYYTPAKVKEVLEKGIYISTVNRDLKAEKDRTVVLYSTLFAAAVSFFLTVLIVLLTKWRNLNQRVGRKDPYD